LNDKSYWFLREAEDHREAALEYTPEGRKVKQRDEDENQRAAEEVFRAEARRRQAEIDARPPEESFEEQIRKVREL
jgi:hypothetical protein